MESGKTIFLFGLMRIVYKNNFVNGCSVLLRFIDETIVKRLQMYSVERLHCRTIFSNEQTNDNEKKNNSSVLSACMLHQHTLTDTRTTVIHLSINSKK